MRLRTLTIHKVEPRASLPDTDATVHMLGTDQECGRYTQGV